jgi:hypothetical protein
MIFCLLNLYIVIQNNQYNSIATIVDGFTLWAIVGCSNLWVWGLIGAQEVSHVFLWVSIIGNVHQITTF